MSSWGLPGKEFSVLHALLLLDTEDDEEPEKEYQNAAYLATLPEVYSIYTDEFTF